MATHQPHTSSRRWCRWRDATDGVEVAVRPVAHVVVLLIHAVVALDVRGIVRVVHHVPATGVGGSEALVLAVRVRCSLTAVPAPPDLLPLQRTDGHMEQWGP